MLRIITAIKALELGTNSIIMIGIFINSVGLENKLIIDKYIIWWCLKLWMWMIV